jgi:hypothetical protein
MAATINYGSGEHDLSGPYRLVPDGGEWFIMGNNMSAPCGTLENAAALFKQLTGRDAFETAPAQQADTGEKSQAPREGGIGRSSFR